LQLHIDGRLEAKLALARDLMSHANPTGDLAVVVERALDVLIEKLRARRFGQTKEVRKTAPTPAHLLDQAKGRLGRDVIRRRKHVPHEVRRQVAERDGYCCSYVSPSGQRCEARAFLELDHERAWARGGDDSVENLRLLCRAHNQLLAEREFGQRVPGRAG
jgi:hypothetical protein